MKPVVVVLSYGELTSLVEDNKSMFLDAVEIKVINALYADALECARKIEDNREADVYVCSGNSSLFRYVKSPYVEIRVTGFDLLLALKKANEFSDRVAILMHNNNKIQYVDEISGMFSLFVKQLTYDSPGEVEGLLRQLVNDGIENVIGPGIVVERGRQLGMNCNLIYSVDSIVTALKTAVNIALSKQAESEKAERFRIIMDFAHEGIVATDESGNITVMNPKAEKILNKSRRQAIGHPIQNVLSNDKLLRAIQSGKAQINEIQTIGEAKIIANMIPLVVHNNVLGAVATFQNIGSIQEAEEKIRKKICDKGLFAKATLDSVLGTSGQISESKQKALLYAKSESTLLITGESGTGKELFAQGIHNASNRATGPFVAINCQALPDNLLESELFGYEDGAFTGARKGGKPGYFEIAHGGTIFLDEIGEISPMLQARLLRVLEEREVMRIGSNYILPVNVRVIAATNINLWESVKAGKFRADLYYRLNVLQMQIPPIRKRKGDIPPLIASFLMELRRDLSDHEIQRISQKAVFQSYDWPGNVRELRNVVERFAVLYTRDVDASALLENILDGEMKNNVMFSAEYRDIYRVLSEVRGNKTQAAKRLGVSRTTLWKRLRQLGVNL